MKKNIIIIICAAVLCASCSFQDGGMDLEAEASETPVETLLETQADVGATSQSSVPMQEQAEDYIPKPGGVIKIDCRNPKTFNPILNEELSVDRLLRLIYEPLVALDERIKPSPAIASGWEFSPDGLSLTIRIRENAVWEDGAPITAGDVAFTLDSIRSAPETALYSKCLANITDYAATDDKTIKINYEKPFSGALYNLTFPVIPRHHFTPERGASPAETPLGSGLYKLSEFNTMRDIKLVASDNSYRGRPLIPEITALIVRNTDVSLYSYDQKLIDIVETKLPNWKKISTTRQSEVFVGATGNYEFLAMSFRNPALKDINIRKAIAHSLPKTEIIDKLYAGNAFEAHTPVNPQSWLYEPEVAHYEYDLGKAKSYKAISTYAFSDEEVLGILVNEDNSERVQTAAWLRDALQEVGIPCRVDIVDFETYSYRVLTGYFDIAVCGLQMPLNPDLSPLFGNAGGVLGEKNFISYRSDVMDGYLAQAEISVFEGPLSAAYSEIQKHFANELPYISILYRANVVLTGKNVYGEAKPVINNAYNNIGELMIRH